jgi:hypothetical protein
MSNRHADSDAARMSPEPPAGDPRHARQLSELRAIADERGRLDERELTAIDKAREFGMTWSQIATALGMHHRQGAEQRHRRLHQAPDPLRQGSLQATGASAPPASGEGDPEHDAQRAVEVAAWARAKLVGLDPHGPRSGALRDLDTVTLAMRRCLVDLRNRADIADRGNRNKDGSERPAWEHRVATGWEASAIDSAMRLRNIADQVTDLARMHAKAVSNHNNARHQRKARQAQRRNFDNLLPGTREATDPDNRAKPG